MCRPIRFSRRVARARTGSRARYRHCETSADKAGDASEATGAARHEIISYVASGGMQDVYRANDKLTGEIGAAAGVVLQTVRCD